MKYDVKAWNSCCKINFSYILKNFKQHYITIKKKISAEFKYPDNKSFYDFAECIMRIGNYNSICRKQHHFEHVRKH